MNPFWMVNEHEYFEAPGLSTLVFHNAYPEGKQGGIEIIQHGERVASCGDLRLGVMPGQWGALPTVGERSVDSETFVVSIAARFEAQDIDYRVSVEPDGVALRITVDLGEPLPPAWVGKVGFNLELFPGAYFGRSFHFGDTHQIFPRQNNGPVGTDDEGHPVSLPLAGGAHFVAVPDDPLHRLEVTSQTGELSLYDGRDGAHNGWFVLRELVPSGATTGAIVWTVRPQSVPTWRRAPMIAISQAGYHPDQNKVAVIELDTRTESLEPATLQRLEPAGAVDVLSRMPESWGPWLRYEYAVFDFTDVRAPGLYVLRYGDAVSPPFPIGPEVYRQNIWQPTLETYFPVQMCHMTVRDGRRVWHGACHLDDALQAPAPHQHFDGYRQYDSTDTDYRPYEHIPHLNRGGWHDAGDYDLAAGSQAQTTHTLALIRELFGVDTDQTTVDREGLEVLLHVPDGVPDIVEQVAHGVDNLLGGYRAAGHSFHGIIANSLVQYAHLGDASTMTDNRVYDSDLAVEAVGGDRTGLMDDRWAFTNRDTALEYMVAATLAAASRVLRDYEPELAEECLTTAQAAYDYEQSHEPVAQPAAYVPRDAEAQEVIATVELLLTTGEDRYRERLVALGSVIEERVMRVGGAVARALFMLDGTALAGRLRAAVAAHREEFSAMVDDNPFGIIFRPHIWGIGWNLQSYAVELYQLWQAFPDLIDVDWILDVVAYMMGRHPASNTSLSSGVGAVSSTVAYGVNRADWSYIPGGVPSGPSLIRPDFMEYKEPWPYLWQQTEYVMPGAANFIFCILAADAILNPQKR